MTENIRPIPGLPGYFASSDGFIYSTHYGWNKMSTNHKVARYYGVNLSLNGKIIRKRVHRLIAEVFIPNPENKPQVNHKNGIRTDNRVENLEWCSSKENVLHAMRLGLNHNIGETHGSAKLTNDQVKEIRNRYIKGKHGSGIYKISEDYGVSSAAIFRVVTRKTFTHIA